jgi:hypothetical protein
VVVSRYETYDVHFMSNTFKSLILLLILIHYVVGKRYPPSGAGYCQRTFIIRDDFSGIISDNDGTKGAYLNGQQCTFVISSTLPSLHVKLDFLFIYTECGYDYINFTMFMMKRQI